MEVFVYAHDEYNKLSGQLLLDTANRLPCALKRRYLDKNGISLNQPSFKSLRKFVVHEINVTTSAYAQAFCEDKEKSRQPQGGHSDFRVRQVALDLGVDAHNGSAESPGSAAAGGREATADHSRGTKKACRRPPICFVCVRADSRHYLVECEKFMKLPPRERRQTVITAGRCLSCLSTEHLARNCPSRWKCRKCGPSCRVKHSSTIHDCYESQNVGATGETKAAPSSSIASSVASISTNNVKNVLKLRVAEEGTFLPEVESRTQGSRPRPRTQKNPKPRPRTAFPRTDPLEAKDRNARGQGQGPRTQAQAFSKKKIFKIFFQAISNSLAYTEF